MSQASKFRVNLKGGFTLIELITVCAVIAVLSAILIPAVSAAKSSVSKAKCASNMRQIGVAISLFSQSNHGQFPLSTHSVQNVEESWIYTLAPYLQDVDAIRICPADPQGEARLKQNLTSYVLNEYVVVANMDPFGNVKSNSYTNLYHLEFPSQTMVAFIASDSMSLGDHSDHTHSRGWSSWGRVTADIQPNRFGSGSSNGLDGSANYLFADGHVENVEATTLREKIIAGINPADPSQL